MCGFGSSAIESVVGGVRTIANPWDGIPGDGGNEWLSPRIGDSGIVSIIDNTGGRIDVVDIVFDLEDTEETDEMVDNRDVSCIIVMGIFRPDPALDCLFCSSLAVAAVALARSASATLSAVNSGTAGIGLDGADCFPNVTILG